MCIIQRNIHVMSLDVNIHVPSSNIMGVIDPLTLGNKSLVRDPHKKYDYARNTAV